jgi:transcriptional regulator with XRE-family HTH domain
MAYGHADKIAAIATGAPAASGEQSAPAVESPPGPTSETRSPWAELYDREDVRRILAKRDIGGLFRVLKDDAGLTQRQLAELTGMSQSEVSDVLKGRRVRGYDVLVRVAQGLGVPRERMGLSYGQSSAYGGQSTVASPEEVTEMLRRHLIELGAVSRWAPRSRD